MSTQPNKSTVSLQSDTTVSSSTPLNSRPTKDYAAALGALQSRYGTGGTTPSPKMYPSKKLPDSLQASPSTSQMSSTRSNLQTNAEDSQTTLAHSSMGSETVNSESEGSAGPSDAARGTSKKSKSKAKAGSILKSIFKGKAKEA